MAFSPIPGFTINSGTPLINNVSTNFGISPYNNGILVFNDDMSFTIDYSQFKIEMSGEFATIAMLLVGEGGMGGNASYNYNSSGNIISGSSGGGGSGGGFIMYNLSDALISNPNLELSFNYSQNNGQWQVSFPYNNETYVTAAYNGSTGATNPTNPPSGGTYAPFGVQPNTNTAIFSPIYTYQGAPGSALNKNYDPPITTGADGQVGNFLVEFIVNSPSTTNANTNIMYNIYAGSSGGAGYAGISNPGSSGQYEGQANQGAGEGGGGDAPSPIPEILPPSGGGTNDVQNIYCGGGGGGGNSIYSPNNSSDDLAQNGGNGGSNLIIFLLSGYPANAPVFFMEPWT